LSQGSDLGYFKVFLSLKLDQVSSFSQPFGVLGFENGGGTFGFLVA
jgi:hypothetical protein